MLTQNDYAYFLYNIPGLGAGRLFKLIENGDTCEEIYRMSEKDLRLFVKERLSKEVTTDKSAIPKTWTEDRKFLNKADASEKIASRITDYKKKWSFEEEELKLQRKGINFVSYFSEKFPKKLQDIPDSPFGIYVKGKLPSIEAPSVAIIGARMCSDYGRFMSREFGRNLALAGVQVISGMARGVDGISQKAAVEAGGRSFGVLGCGVDICYPEENRDVYNSICNLGGLISEYHPGTEPKPGLFPLRNRIISALSDVVLVVEARQKSGTQITVDQALEQGKEVLAVPGRVTDRLSDGCNALISQGAGVALSVEDVLDRLYKVRNISVPNMNSANTGVSVRDSAIATISFDENSKAGDNAGDYESRNCDNEICEKTVEEEMLDVIDIIPVSASAVMEKLHTKGIDLSVPQLMSALMELTYKERVIQDGVYYRRKLV